MSGSINVRSIDGAHALGTPAARTDAETGSAASGLVNAMTVDVEDYFQVWAFEPQVPRDAWDTYPSRVERNTERVLETFAEHGVHATFFTLGWVAERFPQIVRRIVDGGHELASHGYEHARVGEQGRDLFAADVTRTRKLLEDTAGCALNGYRAASFSIDASTPWAFDVLADAGHTYSSSIYPIRHDLYGAPNAPRFAFRPCPGRAFLEIPLSTIAVGGTRVPCGGGGCFRLLPYAVSRRVLRRLHAADARPAVFYFHPWELDPDQPRIAGGSRKARLRHYSRLDRMAGKLRALLDEFRWDRMDRVFPGIGAGDGGGADLP